jgi:hypothetical protein
VKIRERPDPADMYAAHQAIGTAGLARIAGRCPDMNYKTELTIASTISDIHVGAYVYGHATPSIWHVSETAVTCGGVLSSPRGDGRLEPGHQLSPRPSAVVHLEACALAHSRATVGYSPLTDALRPPGPAACRRLPPPARRAAAPQPPACPAVMPISDPVPPSPKRTCVRSPLTAVKVIDQQNVYLLSHTCLFRSLAWRWLIGLASSSRAGCSNTGRLGGTSRPWLSPTDGKCHGMRRYLSLTTVRQRQGPRGERAVFCLGCRAGPSSASLAAVGSLPAPTDGQGSGLATSGHQCVCWYATSW